MPGWMIGCTCNSLDIAFANNIRLNPDWPHIRVKVVARSVLSARTKLQVLTNAQPYIITVINHVQHTEPWPSYFNLGDSTARIFDQ
jgi:hypothetical protein